MIEYAKVILPKVTFSRELFQKELNKCIGWIEESEIDELQQWCVDNFGNVYPDIIADAFDNKAA
ncbi:MAG: hypothetical protein JXR31_15485 [Prolixibacteraceae bacterium]|nr:hypothetical protein [Prolixibacteraceae bacterium]MBN2775656.1 hypothetical protein [Prolixibacteraceae bacterium]